MVTPLQEALKALAEAVDTNSFFNAALLNGLEEVSGEFADHVFASEVQKSLSLIPLIDAVDAERASLCSMHLCRHKKRSFGHD